MIIILLGCFLLLPITYTAALENDYDRWTTELQNDFIYTGITTHNNVETDTIVLNQSVTPPVKEKNPNAHIELGVGFYYLFPLQKEVQPDMLINPSFSIYTNSILQPGLEFAFALNQRHDMDLISPLGTHFTMKRLYDLYMFHVCLTINPFSQWRYVYPSIGVLVGFMDLRDYRINQTYSKDMEPVIRQVGFSIGGKAGLNFFPTPFFILFFETRFYYQPVSIDRPTYISQGIGSEMEQVSDNIRLHYFTAGGGFKFAFTFGREASE